MVLLLLLWDRSLTICCLASVLTLIDSIYIVSRFSSLVPLSFLVLGTWGIHFWSIGWDNGIFLQRCLRIWDGFRSCRFFILGVHYFVGTHSCVLVCSSLVVWVYICRLLYWRICSLMICMCLPLLVLCSLLMRIVFFLGHGVQPEKKSNVPLFGLKVGLSLTMSTSSGFLWHVVVLILISASYLATVQVVFHHLLRSYRHDDRFYHRCRTFCVADSRMELGFDYSAFTCSGMSYSSTGKSDFLFLFIF